MSENHKPKRKHSNNTVAKSNLSAAIVDGYCAEIFDPKKSWQEITDLHNEAVYLLASCTRISSLLRIPGLTDKASPEIINALSNNVNILLKDMENFKNDLESIRASYLDKIDQPCEEDDIVEFLQIAEKYNSWTTSFSTVVLPIKATIIGLVQHLASDIVEVQKIIQ